MLIRSYECPRYQTIAEYAVTVNKLINEIIAQGKFTEGYIVVFYKETNITTDLYFYFSSGSDGIKGSGEKLMQHAL